MGKGGPSWEAAPGPETEMVRQAPGQVGSPRAVTAVVHAP